MIAYIGNPQGLSKITTKSNGLIYQSGTRLMYKTLTLLYNKEKQLEN